MDDKGRKFQLLKGIQDHWKDGMAISKEKENIRNANGMERDKIKTIGWEEMVLCNKGSTD